MAKQTLNDVKLGLFVLAGLLVVMITFYMIGKNRNIFGGGFELKARFSNVNGLMEGNNVLFAGIQAGTVKNIDMINDTTIQVTLQIDGKVKAYIHKNALAAIGTEDLIGNKVVNIIPVKANAPLVSSGDVLANRKLVSTDEMLQTLSKTNNNIASISEVLKASVLRLDSSAIFDVLNDKSIGPSLKSSLTNLNQASNNANNLTQQANAVITSINQEITHGNGPLHILLKDTMIARKISVSLDNVMKGTDGFNQNMEALKHNFFFKGYFNDLEKKKQAAADKAPAKQ